MQNQLLSPNKFKELPSSAELNLPIEIGLLVTKQKVRLLHSEIFFQKIFGIFPFFIYAIAPLFYDSVNKFYFIISFASFLVCILVLWFMVSAHRKLGGFNQPIKLFYAKYDWEIKSLITMDTNNLEIIEYDLDKRLCYLVSNTSIRKLFSGYANKSGLKIDYTLDVQIGNERFHEMKQVFFDRCYFMKHRSKFVLNVQFLCSFPQAIEILNMQLAKIKLLQQANV